MNILVTAIGSMSAEAVINSLKKINNLQVIGCDIHPYPWLRTAKLVDKFYKVPKAKEANYINVIAEICKKQSIDLLFPLTDPEVDELSNQEVFFSRLGTTICISNPNTIKICRDKYKLFNFFRTSEIVTTIPTFKAGELNNLEKLLPLIAKPIKGRSSEGIFFIDEISSQKINNENYSQYILQPIINGNIYTVDYIRDIYGNNLAFPRKELLRTSNGAGLTVELVEDYELEKITNKIGEKLDIKGCVNFEFIKYESKYYLMDINPRFSAGISFTILSGYDIVLNTLKCFRDGHIDDKVNFKKAILRKYFKEEIERNIC